MLFTFSRCSSFVWMTNGKSLIKTKLNSLINSACFRVRSITKKMWKYTVKCTAHDTWYGKIHYKVIWKTEYKFADATIYWLTWWYLSRLTRHCTLNISYRKRRHNFCLIVLQILISAICPRGIPARYFGEKLVENFLWIDLIWFC